MPDDRAPRPPFRDRYPPRPGAISPRPGFNQGFSPRPSGGPPRAPFVPRPPGDSVSVRLRDGDREVEIHGPLSVCRQLLDELPSLWTRLRPHSGSTGSSGQPSISLPTPAAAPRSAEPSGDGRPPEPAQTTRAPEVPGSRPTWAEAEASRDESRAARRRNRRDPSAGAATPGKSTAKSQPKPVDRARTAAPAPTHASSNGAGSQLADEIVSILRRAAGPIGIAEIRSRLAEDVSGQAVRRILERTQGVANVGGRPAAYRLR